MVCHVLNAEILREREANGTLAFVKEPNGFVYLKIECV